MTTADGSADVELEDDELQDAPVEEEVDAAPAPVTSDAALLLEDARFITSRHGALVVLLLGEVGSGKSTLLVELWSELLLHGAIDGHQLAGSVTALAFEERSFLSRVRSGRPEPETVRTREADDGFLHLRVKRADGVIVELLLADVTGEHSRNIREGTPVSDEFAWLARVDRFLVLIDGAAYAKAETREVTVTRTQRLLHALATSGDVAQTARVAIALSKDDQLDDPDRAAYADVESTLLQLARRTDETAVAWRLAARPKDLSPPRGLDLLLSWLASADAPRATAPAAAADRGARAMSRFTS